MERLTDKELFPELTIQTCHETISFLVHALARKAQDAILKDKQVAWDSQDGLLAFEVRETLATANKQIAEFRKLHSEGKLRIR